MNLHGERAFFYAGLLAGKEGDFFVCLIDRKPADSTFHSHRRMSYDPVRRRLPCGGDTVLPHIQTAADFFKSGNVDNRLNEREQRP
jgi:hypothetical protein